MGSMAIGAMRGIIIIFCMENTMGAFVIELHHFSVADGTVYLAGILTDRTIFMIYIYMALGTGNCLFLMD